ncbi:Protease 3 precursor [Serratia fonticola]|uniref:Protease 3 n=1 Tax=Serratia fonticola TaxID=47917 RepID=A0A4U9V598_SERFO|nr:Protease 3 precursor [Serratia fonticola]
MTVALRNAKTMDSARNQVLFSLMDYLAGISLDELSYQASVGGISFSTSPNNGLMFSANGFTQRLPQLLTSLIEGYSSFTPTQEQLEQAKSWYLEQLDSAEKGKAFELAIQPVQMLSRVPYSERSERREVLKTITLQDVLAYRDSLMAGATPELLVVGNMSKQQVDTLASSLKKNLGCTGVEWWHGENVVIAKTSLPTCSVLAAAPIRRWRRCMFQRV